VVRVFKSNIIADKLYNDTSYAKSLADPEKILGGVIFRTGVIFVRPNRRYSRTSIIRTSINQKVNYPDHFEKNSKMKYFIEKGIPQSKILLLRSLRDEDAQKRLKN